MFSRPVTTTQYRDLVYRRTRSATAVSGIKTPDCFPYDLYVTVSDASRLSGLSEKFWFSMIRRKILPAFSAGLDRAGLCTPEKLPENLTVAEHASVTYISAKHLPIDAQEVFFAEQIVKGAAFHMDFIGFMSLHGPEAFDRLLRSIDVIREGSSIRARHRANLTDRIASYAIAQHLSPATYSSVRAGFRQ